MHFSISDSVFHLPGSYTFQKAGIQDSMWLPAVEQWVIDWIIPDQYTEQV